MYSLGSLFHRSIITTTCSPVPVFSFHRYSFLSLPLSMCFRRTSSTPPPSIFSIFLSIFHKLTQGPQDLLLSHHTYNLYNVSFLHVLLPRPSLLLPSLISGMFSPFLHILLEILVILVTPSVSVDIYWSVSSRGRCSDFIVSEEPCIRFLCFSRDLLPLHTLE